MGVRRHCAGPSSPAVARHSTTEPHILSHLFVSLLSLKFHWRGWLCIQIITCVRGDNIMIRRFQLCYGFVAKALALFQSYLEGRTQPVVIRDAPSNTTRVTPGVPQGSVLGPLLFSLYLQPIGDIITAHGFFPITTLKTCSYTSF